METEATRELIERYYDAAAVGDRDALATMLTDAARQVTALLSV